jgi:hypothetical protein
MKTINALFAAAVLSFSACKKDDKPSQHSQEESGPAKEGLFTRADYYFRLSDSATMKPWHSDSIYYNTKYQISKVVDNNSGDQIINYMFTYNTDGTIAAMKVRSAADYKQDYRFYYKDSRIDSFVVYDSAAINPAPLLYTNKATYNAQSALERITMREAGKIVYSIVYNRSTRLDSIRANFGSDGAIGYRTMHVAAGVAPVNALLAGLDPAYKLLLAVRQDQYLTSIGSNTLFLHDFLSPGDPVFNDGVFTKGNDLVGKSYKHTYTADSKIKTYRYLEADEDKFGLKFHYFTK